MVGISTPKRRSRSMTALPPRRRGPDLLRDLDELPVSGPANGLGGPGSIEFLFCEAQTGRGGAWDSGFRI